MQTCSTCGKPANRPYRYISPDGQYREGCIARAHDAEPDDWHRQQVAKFKAKGIKRP